MTTQTETAWCPTCGKRRAVMDTYATDEGDRYGDRPADRRPRIAVALECGHDATGGGAEPRPAREVDDAALVARLAELQQGQR